MIIALGTISPRDCKPPQIGPYLLVDPPPDHGGYPFELGADGTLAGAGGNPPPISGTPLGVCVALPSDSICPWV